MQINALSSLVLALALVLWTPGYSVFGEMAKIKIPEADLAELEQSCREEWRGGDSIPSLRESDPRSGNKRDVA